MNGRKMSDASLIQHYHEHVFKNIKLSTQKILFQFDGQYLTSANVVYVSYLIVNLSNISVHLETKRNQRNFYSSYSSYLLLITIHVYRFQKIQILKIIRYFAIISPLMASLNYKA